MMKKQFKISADQIRILVTRYGSCIASDRITVDGKSVSYMYRELPRNSTDSGWHFFSGDESQEYVDDPENLGIYDVNTIVNYDPKITAILDRPIGTAWTRDDNGRFIEERIPSPR